MLAILHLLVMVVAHIFKSRRRLEAENLFLRHQLNIALRQAPPRLRLRGSDRALLVWMTRLWPSLIGAAQVVQPETILRWHRAGWKAFWRWKSRKRAGRPKIDRGLRDLIQRISRTRPTCCNSAVRVTELNHRNSAPNLDSQKEAACDSILQRCRWLPAFYGAPPYSSLRQPT